MSKIARAARVASRHRVETISASKTIQSAETGETYLIDHNAASALTITLPAKQDGAYFKFIWKTAMSDNSATVVIQSSEGVNGDFAGTVVEYTVHATDGAVATETAGSHHKLTIGSSNDTSIGTWVECVCDGSVWYFTGCVVGAAVGNAVFGT